MLSRPENPPITSRWFGLDALRALAIVLVLAYHLNLAGIANGGFLGVDLFFVISGFLITSLLLAEHQQTGRIALKPFFVRRFHRLFPPFAVMVLVCTWFTPRGAPQAYARLIADLPYTFYLSNWWQIYSQQSYFEGIHNPRVFQHLWSLAIEEQYYVLWPVLLYWMLGRYARTTVAYVCLGLALGSTLWMAYWYAFVLEGADPSRVYFGSDTHVMGLFIGAGLACLWNPAMQGAASLRICRDARLRVPLTLWALAALLWMGWNWNDQIPLLYLGGFAIFSACSALLIVLVTDPASVLGFSVPVLGPLRALTHWIGTRSYSLYLWHWPLFIWIDAQHAFTPWLTAERLVVTALAAECSYRFVELSWKQTLSPASRTRWSAAVAFAFIVSAVCAVHNYVPDPHPHSSELTNTEPVESGSTANEPAGVAKQDAPGPGEGYMRFDTQGQRTLVLGDSVILGARSALLRAFPAAYVDAEVGRQASQGLAVLKLFFATHKTPDFVVIHLGTNGYIYEKHLRQILEFLRNSTRVVVVNNYADRRWTAQNNELIQKVLVDFDNVRLVDWSAIGSENPGYFVADGVHLSGKGLRRFVNAIGEALNLTGAPVTQAKRSRPASAAEPLPERPESTAQDAQAGVCPPGDAGAQPPLCARPPEAVYAPPASPGAERE